MDKHSISVRTEKCQHCCSVLPGRLTVRAVHEQRAQYPRTWPVQAGHHVHPVRIIGWRLPGHLAVCE